MLRKKIRQALGWLITAKGLRIPDGLCIKDLLSVLLNHVERDVLRTAGKLVKPGDVVLDVGANMGLTARAFCKLVGPSGRVFAFEPDPSTAALLRHNVANFRQCEVREIAVSDHAGTARFHIHGASTAGSSLVPSSAHMRSIDVALLPLDRFISDESLNRIDLVKIDVEGAEPKVLRGFESSLERFPNVRLVIEFCPENLRSGGVTPDDFFSILEKLKLRVASMDARGDARPAQSAADLTGRLNNSGYVNILCSRH
jgi:FkbM family methyltransferase